jgi:hypothetical protein
MNAYLIQSCDLQLVAGGDSFRSIGFRGWLTGVFGPLKMIGRTLYEEAHGSEGWVRVKGRYETTGTGLPEKWGFEGKFNYITHEPSDFVRRKLPQ